MISAQIIADSVNACGNRLTTYVLKYPWYIHWDLLTHRDLSRNTMSTRAMPIWKVLQQVWEEPAMPIVWGTNGKGMQAKGELSNTKRWLAKGVWVGASFCAMGAAWALSKIGLHKQDTNKLLVPFMHNTAIISATEWGNFFNLRAHEAAHPTIQALAYAMLKEYVKSKPTLLQPGEWHVPFADNFIMDGMPLVEKLKISTARCARISYLNFEGHFEPEKDYQLHDNLLENGHMCFDSETEVLTDSGWKSWPNVNREDKLVAVNINKETATFECPSHLVRKYYDGLMYKLKCQQIDLLVTPSHNMVVSPKGTYDSWNAFQLKQANHVVSLRNRHMKTCQLCTTERTPVLNPFGVDRLVFAKLIGFFAGDGTIGSINTISFGLRKQRKIRFLHGLGLKINHWKNDKYAIELDGIGSWFQKHGYDVNKEKVIYQEYLTATTEEIKALFDGLKNSDGSLKRNTWKYNTTSAPLRDQIQAIAHVNSYVTSNSTGSYPHGDYYHLNFCKWKYPATGTAKQKDGRVAIYSEGWVPYKGEVFCATVSTGAILVRRDKKVLVSGNSPFEHCANADSIPSRSGNFVGFTQYRKLLPNENRVEFDAVKLLARGKQD